MKVSFMARGPLSAARKVLLYKGMDLTLTLPPLTLTLTQGAGLQGHGPILC